MSPVVISILAFLGVVCVVVIAALVFGGEKSKLDARLTDLAANKDPSMVARQAEQDALRSVSKKAMPALNKSMMPEENTKEATMLKSRLVAAGFYSTTAPTAFVLVKTIMSFGPLALGVLAWMSGMGTVNGIPAGLFGGVLGSIIGIVGPSFWLDGRKTARQTTLRRSLPDAMDVMVICLEGGLSLPASLAKVAEEMKVAHPMLAFEFTIVQREIQLGKNTAGALKELAKRSDLDEIRSLAAVIQQAEKYGSSMSKALRIHADTLRIKRTQRAEELAAKASTKVLFPTLLFIFPGIFVVILGPAFFQIMDMMSKVTK